MELTDLYEMLYQFIGSSVLIVGVSLREFWLVVPSVVIGLGVLIYRGNKAAQRYDNEK